MMRLNNQRGVSLLLLIIAITVFAAVAIGTVGLIRSRHETYPYQVQSYQAYALAQAGIEFAMRLARDNDSPSDPNSFVNNPGAYIPIDGSSKSFRFGNGWFSLRYARGCSGPQPWDVLYSRGCLSQPAADGTCPTPSREIQLAAFSVFSQVNPQLLISSTITRTPYSRAGYAGDRIEFNFCNPALSLSSSTTMYLNYSGSGYQLMSGFSRSTRMAAVALNNAVRDPTQTIYLGRFALTGGFYPFQNNARPIQWIYDMGCGIPFQPQYSDPAYNAGNSNQFCNVTPDQGTKDSWGGTVEYNYQAPVWDAVNMRWIWPPAASQPFQADYNGVQLYYQAYPISGTWDGTGTPTIDQVMESVGENGNFCTPPDYAHRWSKPNPVDCFTRSQLRQIPWNTKTENASMSRLVGWTTYLNIDDRCRPRIPYNQYTNWQYAYPRPLGGCICGDPNDPECCPDSTTRCSYMGMAPYWAETRCFDDNPCYDGQFVGQGARGGRTGNYCAYGPPQNQGICGMSSFSIDPAQARVVIETIGRLPMPYPWETPDPSKAVKFYLRILYNNYSSPQSAKSSDLAFSISSGTPTCDPSTSYTCFPRTAPQCLCDGAPCNPPLPSGSPVCGW